MRTIIDDIYYKVGATVTKDNTTLYRVVSRGRRNPRTEMYKYELELLDPKTEQRHQIENFIFSYIPNSTIIIAYYKEVSTEHIADRYLANSSEQATTIFEQLKAYVPKPIPVNCKHICDITSKSCDPDSWVCHRQFAAIRFLKDHPGTLSNNKECPHLKLKDALLIQSSKDQKEKGR